MSTQEPEHHAGRKKYKPQARTSLSHEQVPLFIYGDSYTTPVGDNARPIKVVEVTCGRKDCGETFIVPLKKWKTLRSVTVNREGIKQEVQFICRPCPWCYKVGRI